LREINSMNFIYRAGRRAFMPDTIVPVGGHSCPIQSCLKALLPTQMERSDRRRRE